MGYITRRSIESRKFFFTSMVKLCKEWKSVTEDNVESDISNFSKRFSDDIESLQVEGRKIKIGVVGQVKAGKSTFLNSMLFNGRSILPKAATPMTAALTVIEYAEKIEAEVEFFNDKDWNIIEEKNKEYNNLVKSHNDKGRDKKRPLIPVEIPDELKAAHELIEKAKDFRGSSLLNTIKKIDNISSIGDLSGKLETYVGANGKYTPFTKSLKIKLNIEELKDIEVIDTPGINDPIVSRGMRTKDFLGKCDAVFLLSYAAQFMGKVDAGFLTDSLPNVGIKRVVLIGSKFDSALMDEGKRYQGNLRSALLDLRRKLGQQAENSLRPIIDANKESGLMKAVEKCLPPVFISGMAYNLAVRDYAQLDEEEKHILNRLKKLFPDWDFTKEILLDLSNIPAVKANNLDQIKKEKEKIISDRLGDRISGADKEYRKIFEDINSNVLQTLNELKDGNHVELQNEANKFKSCLDEADSEIKTIFNDFILDISKDIHSLILDIDGLRHGHKIKTQTESYEESYEVKVKISGAWNGFKSLFGCESYDDVTKYRTVTNKYAEVYDAIEGVQNCISDGVRYIQRFWQGEFSKDKFQQLKKELLQVVENNIDTHDESLEISKLRKAIAQATDRIPIPSCDINSKYFTDIIESAFSSPTVSGSDIDELKTTHREVMSQCISKMSSILTNSISKAEKDFKLKRDNFVKELKFQIDSKITELKEKLKNKKEEIKTYEEFLKHMKKYKLM